MNQKLWVFIMLFFSVSAFSQTTLKGVIIDFSTGKPVEKATVYLKNQGKSVVTDKHGVFIFEDLSPRSEVISVSAPSHAPYESSLVLKKGDITDAGRIALIKNSGNPRSDEAVRTFDESMIDDDDGNDQSVSYLSGGSDDVFLQAASYNFSPMRYSLRGYDQRDESTFINGIDFNDLERGRFNYSSLGGLNDVVRNKDIIIGIDYSPFDYGNLGGSTNINTRASQYAAGTKVGLAYTNRAYNLRAMATYSTGLMSNGWAFTGSLAYRWANEGIIDGTFYNSLGYFLAGEKVINEHHRISLTTYGAPTKRAQSAAVTQEVYDLRNIYYNPYWGYQNDKKRNSRVVSSYDPTVILNWDFDIDGKQSLKTGAAFHYSNYSNTALTFYNAPDPRPDYYRNLPSFQYTSMYDAPESEINVALADLIARLWREDNPKITQIDWYQLYQSNYRNNVVNPSGSARYMIEERHNNLMETMLHSLYTNQIRKELTLTGGISLKYAKGMHYKTVNDLLGGKQWIDIDQFAERDFSTNTKIIQNDIRFPYRAVKKGDTFGYDYNMLMFKGNAFLQNNWNLPLFDIYYAAQLTYLQFQRDGKMENGRAAVIGAQSLGKGKRTYFLSPSAKAGFVYKISGHHRVWVDVLAEMRAPLPGYSYVSPRIKDTQLEGLQQEKVYSYDINYQFTTPVVRGRVTAFQTHFIDGVESTGYYHDEFRTFINHTLWGVNKVFRGFEAGVDIKLNQNFSLALAGTYGDYRYTNNANGVMSAESGIDVLTGELPVRDPVTGKFPSGDLREKVYTKDLKVSNGPQAAGSISLHFFHPKMWFADVTYSYFGRNYLDFSPSRFTAMNYVGGKYKNEEGRLQQYDGYTPEQKKLLGTQQKLKDGGLLDASVGKVIYLNNRSQSVNINLTFSNILNNKKMVTGGYQQGRLSRNNKSATKAIETVDKFPNKYYYAWGFNCFLNVSYKF